VNANTTDVNRRSIRPVHTDDHDLLLRWRNLPAIRDLGASQRDVTAEEHRRWFVETLLARTRRLWIVIQQDAPVGMVRYDFVDCNSAEVSIFLLEDHVGQGLGSFALTASTRAISEETTVGAILARVRVENKRSLRFFQRAGFVIDRSSPKSDELVRLKLLLNP
jgi:RimJ/RimL family protein N-acetyltransferase